MTEGTGLTHADPPRPKLWGHERPRPWPRSPGLTGRLGAVNSPT